CSDVRIGVTLVEGEASFVSCPLSNLVLGGSRTIADVTVSYDGLDKWDVRRVSDVATDIDAGARKLKLAGGSSLDYDRLILSPGVDFRWEEIPSLAGGAAQDRIPHAWKAGSQPVLLRRELEAKRAGCGL